MKWQLIDELPHWHRLWSIRFAILSALFEALVKAWPLLPVAWQAAMPDAVVTGLSMAALASAGAAAVARVIKQSRVHADETDEAGA